MSTGSTSPSPRALHAGAPGHPARLWQGLDDGSGRVRCSLCAHRCTIAEGKRGICGVRENRQGRLVSLVYGQLVAMGVDPIEKKPLFHFYPGSGTLSIATRGCNFTCAFCQNADISQETAAAGLRARVTTPETVVAAARDSGCVSVAYTYTEPTVFMEYASDVAQLAASAGLGNVQVTNGYMTAETLAVLLPEDGPRLLDAANVDLKAFTDAFYRQQCGARLQPVLDSLVRLRESGVWVEVTTLLIPGLNDDERELRDLSDFICSELGADTPWHVSRFHPTYHLLNRPPTSVATLLRAREIGLEAGLHYVYTGNIPGQGGEDTLCPRCGAVAISREGFRLRWNRASGGRCAACGEPIAGVGL